jgi:hypothetical protein
MNSESVKPSSGGGKKVVIAVSLITWVMCSLPVAMLLGYCALGEERYSHDARHFDEPAAPEQADRSGITLSPG